jgi:hypothetical protein
MQSPLMRLHEVTMVKSQITSTHGAAEPASRSPFSLQETGESIPPRRSPSVSASPFARGEALESLRRGGAELTFVVDQHINAPALRSVLDVVRVGWAGMARRHPCVVPTPSARAMLHEGKTMSTMTSPRVSSAVFLLLFLGGCASSAPTEEKITDVPLEGPEVELPNIAAYLPTADDIDEMLTSPSPQKVPRGESHEPEHWDLAGPLPRFGGSTRRAPVTAVERRLVDERADLVLTEQHVCTAREVGRVATRSRVLPGKRLFNFLAGACGLTTSTWSVVILPFAAHVKDETIAEDPDLLEHIRGLPDGAHVGLAVVRADGRIVVGVIAHVPAFVADDFSLVPDATGHVVVEGIAREPISDLRAFGTLGATEVAECVRDPVVVSPRVRLVCPVDRRDATAIVDVMHMRPGQVLAPPLFTALLRPSGIEPLHFRGDGAIDDEGSGSAVERIARAVNARRRDAGLTELAVSFPQSALAARIGRGFLEARLAGATAVVEGLSRAMIAGTAIDAAVISWGEIGSEAVDVTDPNAVAGVLFSRAATRATLLDPRADVFAVAVEPAAGHFVVLFGVWSTQLGAPPDVASQAIYEALVRTRGAAKDTNRLDDVDDILAQAREDFAATRRVGPTLTRVQKLISRRHQRSVRGWVARTTSLDVLTFPRELLEPRVVDVALTAQFDREPGEKWGSYVILLAYDDR